MFRLAALWGSMAALTAASYAGGQPFDIDAECRAPFDKLLGDRTFAHYAVPVGKLKPAQPDVRRGDAHLYRTVIREVAKSGPNFAGHYTLIEIGCGAATSCIAIADARSGRVYFPENLKSTTALLMDTGKFRPPNLNYRLSSRLLIVVGNPNELLKRTGMSYYLWNGSTLKLLRFVPVDTLCKR